MADTLTPRHDLAAQHFELDVDGHKAIAHYRVLGATTLIFDHTFVPDALRGRGLAAIVVKTGLDYAREHGMRVVPRCSYVDGYIKRHGEYADLLAPE